MIQHYNEAAGGKENKVIKEQEKQNGFLKLGIRKLHNRVKCFQLHQEPR